MLRFASKYWFLIGLFAVVGLGFAAHGELRGLADKSVLRSATVFTVLFLMTLPLPAEVIWKVLRRPAAAVFASIINLTLIPLLAWCGSWGFSEQYAQGLIVAAATPCTIASAAVWTRRAGGNDSVAIMVTVLTNLLCFMTTPLTVWLLTGSQTGSSELGNLIAKLGLLVLAPMVLAQIARRIGWLGNWSTREKKRLGVVAQLGILLMLLIGSVKSGAALAQSDAGGISPWLLGLLTLTVIVIHLATMYCGWHISSLWSLERAERIAIAFACSQKTLLVGLSVSIEMGCSILPIVLFHVSQLLLDTFIADRMSKSQVHPQGDGESAKVD